ncbi:MAG: hypothetical protein RLZZ450_2135 [Pseudomonadota bacterium]|jgi:uncharacterized membrane protein
MTQVMPPRSRLVFIDVLRLIAAVQMIQGHSVASVLAPSYRHGPAFETWTFARGLTSVIFLVTAGLSFCLAEGRANDPASRWARVRRALGLVLLGYLMHAPLGVVLGAPLAETLRAAVVVDVLHCIGVSLLSLELLTFAVDAALPRAIIAGSFGLGALFAAPLTRSLSFSDRWSWLGNYVTGHAGSLFPLSPWAGYLGCGFALGTLLLKTPRRLASGLAGAGSTTLLVGLFLLSAYADVPRGVSPAYSLVKLGCVLLLAALLASLLRDVARLPHLLAVLAGETLFLYLSHVIVLYADHVGLEPRLRDSHSPLFGVSLAALLLVSCCAAALLLRSLRRRSGSGTRAAQSP